MLKKSLLNYNNNTRNSLKSFILLNKFSFQFKLNNVEKKQNFKFYLNNNKKSFSTFENKNIFINKRNFMTNNKNNLLRKGLFIEILRKKI